MSVARIWMRVGREWMPFADASSEELPMRRLLRLSLFQISVGMAAVLLIGTLNRVLIVEMGVAAGLVASMVALPLLFAPFRALIGFRSDNHRSALGWRRVPYLWFGTIFQFSGLAMMPFALILLSGDTTGPAWAGHLAAAIAFLLVGAGMHTVQTIGLALATDLSPQHKQPQVVALLSVMLLAGMLISGLVFGWLLSPFSQIALIQVIQGAAVVTLVLNLVAVWKQEPLTPDAPREAEPNLLAAWRELAAAGPWRRQLTATALGTAAFSMQDILLEPYGGEILGLPVGTTTLLTAWFATGGIVGFTLAARWIARGADEHRIAGYGAATGALAFALVTLAAPLASGLVFAAGVGLIGAGGGLYAHGTLTGCMRAAPAGRIGLAIGTWGAVQASAAGLAIAAGGLLRDSINALALSGRLGEALSGPSIGYTSVYLIEIVLLFATLAAIGPLVRARLPDNPQPRGAGASRLAT